LNIAQAKAVSATKRLMHNRKGGEGRSHPLLQSSCSP
jgi:hypothetical protein